MAGVHEVELLEAPGQGTDQIVLDVGAIPDGERWQVVDQIVAVARLGQEHADIAAVKAVGLEVIVALWIVRGWRCLSHNHRHRPAPKESGWQEPRISHRR